MPTRLGQFGFHNVSPDTSLPRDIYNRARGTLSQIGSEVQRGDLTNWPNPEELPYGDVNPQKALDVGIEAIMPAAKLGSIAGTIIPSHKAPDLLNLAKDLDKAGATKSSIAKETGHYKDKAGNWKTQISDIDSSLTPLMESRYQAALKSNKAKSHGVFTSLPGTRLGTLYRHERLYDMYPEISKKVRVKFDKELDGVGKLESHFTKGGTGEWKFANLIINPTEVGIMARKLNKSEQEILMDIINHETNHVIQALENMPSGSSSKYFETIKTPQYKNKKLAEKTDLEMNYVSSKNPKKQLEYKTKIDKIDSHLEFIDKIQEVDNDLLYMNTLGEADAFWSQAMRKHPDPASKVPLHENPVYDTTSAWGHTARALPDEYVPITSARETTATGGVNIKTPKKPTTENPYQRNDRLMKETGEELKKWQGLRDKVVSGKMSSAEKAAREKILNEKIEKLRYGKEAEWAREFAYKKANPIEKQRADQIANKINSQVLDLENEIRILNGLDPLPNPYGKK